MTRQLELTRAVFARVGYALRRRSEALLAISAPVIFLIVLISAGVAGVITRMPPPSSMRTIEYVQSAEIVVLIVQWMLAFFAFGALASFAAGERSVAECWRAALRHWKALLALALLCWIFWFGLSLTRPLLARRAIPALAQPAAVYGWTVASLLLVLALSTCVPHRMRAPISAMDALANSMRFSGSDYFVRLLIAVVFVVLPQAAIQGTTIALQKHLQNLRQTDPQKLSAWANWGRAYLFGSFLITLLMIFIGLYALSVLYELREKPQEEV